jgi:Fe-S-cluster containining protein
MDLTVKLNVLNQLYEIYENFINDYNFFCEKGCSFCCTKNVTMTSLEGYKVITHLQQQNQMGLVKLVEKSIPEKRFIPRVTINQIAELYTRGEEPPEEETAPVSAPCPILTNKRTCPIYEARPFGCRCFFSRADCRENGFADLDELILTVNNLFIQYIEHIDEHGITGNFTDILAFLSGRDNLGLYQKNTLEESYTNLLKNQKISLLLVPPEYEAQVKKVNQEIQEIKIPKSAIR